MSLVETYKVLKAMGAYLPAPYTFAKQAQQVRTIALDWDGVFTSGEKYVSGDSSFSEADSMGINLLRYGYYLYHQKGIKIFIITGENNPTAITLAEREHFDGVFYGIKNKIEVIDTLQTNYEVNPKEILFVFDDVLDLSLANQCGLRLMVRRSASPLLTEYVKKSRQMDYLTAHDGGKNALRECSEILLSALGNFKEVVDNRVAFSDSYQDYFVARNQIKTVFYTKNNKGTIVKA